MMSRAWLFRPAAAATVALGSLTFAPSARASASPVPLVVPQSVAFAVLGYSCGGIQQQDFGSRFDPANGYPDGNAYVSTACDAGGKGGHSVTYSAWLATTWDFTGALVTYSTLAAAPTVNPTLSVFDAHGNNLYNQSNQAFVSLAPGYVPAPRVSGLAPSSAPQGTTVTITGTGFTGATAVEFGTLVASGVTVLSDTSITAVAPALRTGAMNVKVVGPGGVSATNTSDVFTFTFTPRISGLSPNQGSADGGTSVTISGVNFTHATAVTFGGVPARFKVVNDTTITARSPSIADPAAVSVTVSNKQGTSAITSSDQFTYTN